VVQPGVYSSSLAVGKGSKLAVDTDTETKFSEDSLLPMSQTPTVSAHPCFRRNSASLMPQAVALSTHPRAARLAELTGITRTVGSPRAVMGYVSVQPDAKQSHPELLIGLKVDITRTSSDLYGRQPIRSNISTTCCAL